MTGSAPDGIAKRALSLALRLNLVFWLLSVVLTHAPAKLWNGVTLNKILFISGATLAGFALCWLWFLLALRIWKSGSRAFLPVSVAALLALVFGYNAAVAFAGVTASTLTIVVNGEPRVVELDVWLINSWVLVGWAPFAFGTTSIAMLAIFRAEAREGKLALLQAQAREAQLSALRLQINPAFLFDALETISDLVETGRKVEAEQMVLACSDVLRAALTAAPGELSRLDEEFDFAKAYGAVEQLRSGGAFVMTAELPDELRGARVPHLLIQPFIDAAIRAAPAGSSQRRTLALAAARDGASLTLSIAQTGIFDADSQGLSQTLTRLRALYGDDAALATRFATSGNMTTIELPLTLPDAQHITAQARFVAASR